MVGRASQVQPKEARKAHPNCCDVIADNMPLKSATSPALAMSVELHLYRSTIVAHSRRSRNLRVVFDRRRRLKQLPQRRPSAASWMCCDVASDTCG